MANRSDTGAGDRSRISRLAHVIERIGLAMAGALCGLFVAAHLAKANIEVLNSVEVLLSMILYGSIGYYLGINIPLLPSRGRHAALSDAGPIPKTDPIVLVSATGTFLAAVAAPESVYTTVFEDVPQEISN